MHGCPPDDPYVLLAPVNYLAEWIQEWATASGNSGGE
jgi:hypothetical protein